MHRSKVKRIFLKKFLRGYMRLALVMIGIFGVVGMFHPGFFSYGARYLSQVLATGFSVTGFVLPPPATPTFTSDLTCNPLNLSMALKLDWQVDSTAGTYSYDILRDGLPLVSGLSSSTITYTDTSLTIATTYTYTLRAIGPMGPGFADSTPLVLTTPYNCDGLSQPTLSVTKFQNRLIGTYEGIAFTHTRQPTVVGASNIPYARIRIVIDGETKLVAETEANINGYWEWKPSVRLNFERSTMYFTATDPLNSNRTAETALWYQVIRTEESEKGESKKNGRTGSPVYSPNQGETISPSKGSVKFSFTSNQREVRQGENIKFTFTPTELSGESEQNTEVEFRLLDKDGHALATLTKDIFLRVNEATQTEMKVPLYLRPGDYRVEAVFARDGTLYSQSISIVVKSLPVIALSSGREITYDEFMWNFGWISLVTLSTVALWLFFIFYEYWLFLKGNRQTDEFKIGRLGYFSRL